MTGDFFEFFSFKQKENIVRRKTFLYEVETAPDNFHALQLDKGQSDVNISRLTIDDYHR